MSERMTCLVYYINEGLCVIPGEVADRFGSILACEDRLDEGGELIRGKITPDQTLHRCGIGKEGPVSSRHLIQGRRKGGQFLPILDAEFAVASQESVGSD